MARCASSLSYCALQTDDDREAAAVGPLASDVTIPIGQLVIFSARSANLSALVMLLSRCSRRGSVATPALRPRGPLCRLGSAPQAMDAGRCAISPYFQLAVTPK